MWSCHWSPLTQTSLLLSPSDGLASFLETILANGVKVVEKVITSKFRFHLIAIYALGCFCNFSCTHVPKLPCRAGPQPRETSERMNFNIIDKKKQLTWKLFIYWYLMSFFHKKMSHNFWATIMPFGPLTLFFYWPKKWPHFMRWYPRLSSSRGMKKTTYDVENPGSDLRQAKKCGGFKPVNGIPTFPSFACFCHKLN